MGGKVAAPATRWRVFPENKEVSGRLAEAIGVSPLIGQLLLNRGLKSLAEAKRYMGVGGASSLHSSVPGEGGFPTEWVRDVAALFAHHLQKGSRVLLIGDYDVDGMTSSTIALGVLKEIGLKVKSYIPHRFDDGYGVNMGVMGEAVRSGYGLVITLDCGISNVAEIAYLKTHSPETDVIIMDHHRVPNPAPAANVIINPQLLDARDPLHLLCTAGIVFLLLKQVCELAFPGVDVMRFVDVAALGTVADIVPLKDANRDIVREGLVALAQSPHAGLRALLSECNLGGRELTSEDIGFGIGPRLNAAGRLTHAKMGVDLLTEPDWNKAVHLAKRLNNLNQDRRQLGEFSLLEVEQQLSIQPELLAVPILVMSHTQWHAGVIGITAAQLVRRYERPVVLVAVDDGVGRGSARSVPGVDIYSILKTVSHHMESFGGHHQAAGFKILPENIPAFEAELRAKADVSITDEDLQLYVDVDGALSPDQMSVQTAESLQVLAPFGHQNTAPVFYSDQLIPIDSKLVGDGKHLKVRFQDRDSNKTVDAIGFGLADKLSTLYKERVEILFHLEVNEWNGMVKPQLKLVDVR
ncbi:MAG: single-stranded-DNA-specific exonuclease RecJ [bacterium]|nr:single-stranded-DNA-specific exonuclease RecJ [bacterium]